MAEKQIPETRSAYRFFRPVTTRWMDNDIYGHVNNVVYYSWFDTALNAWLIERGVLDIHDGATIGLMVENHCNYFAPVAFPQPVDTGLRVGHVGNSSVRYEIGIFAAGQDGAAEPDSRALAQGHLVHVYVDRQTRRPVPLPAPLRAALKDLEKTA